MKKIIILALALAGATGSVLSQQTITFIDGVPTSKTDQMFQNYQIGPKRIRFDFNFTNGNRMRMELTSLKQIDSLPPLESLLSDVQKALSLLEDSLTNPLYNKRVDYIKRLTDSRVRIKSYPPSGDVYSLQNNNQVTQLKVEQDTLRISLFTMDDLFIVNSEKRYASRPYSLTFFLNNISDLKTIPVDKLNATIEELNKEIAPSKAKEKRYSGVNYYALYDVNTQKKLRTFWRTPESTKIQFSTDPYVQSGFQFMRGAAVPSVGAGFELVQKKSEDFQREWRLMWEPLFFFSRDVNNKLRMDRNDFITFRQHSQSKFKSLNREIEFVQNLSFGYLIRRKGDWLEKNTFKFSLPTGIQYKNILLESEFLFNDFFQNFSPSMKLTLIFE
jgi:hypothetical protein